MSEVKLPATAALAVVLACLSLVPVFSSGDWFIPTLLAVLAGVIGCWGARRLRLPGPLVPLVGAVALLLYLTVLFAGAEAHYGVLPGRDALHRLAELALQGRIDINRYAAPIAVLPGVLLITTAGIGLVAVAVDTIAVTMRTPAASGLALLAVYSVPAAVVPGGVSPVAFVLGAAGYLLLLLVDEQDRVGRWGRPLELGGFADRVSATPLAAVGRRVGLVAIAFAVVLPIAVPGLDDGVLGNGRAGGGGRGNRTVAVVNPILNLQEDLRRPDDRELLTYTTDDSDPGYLRVVGLDVFTGRQWEASRLQVPPGQSVGRGLGTPVGLGGPVRVEIRRTEVRVGPLETRWLPLPFPTSRVEIDGTWLYDRATYNVFSTSTTTRDREYVVEHLDVQPVPEELRAAGSPPEDLDRFLALPEDLDRSLIQGAVRRVTAGALTPYEQALAVQTWLRSDFRYSTEAPDGTGIDAISAFLAQRRGFCVHFASTMAVMARELGIPARVAVGFLPGDRGPPGRYAVSVHDAHAWPELYFEGVGWVPFEPTPAARTGAPPLYARPADPSTPGGSSTAAPSAEPTDSAAGGSAQNPRSREQLEEELARRRAQEAAAAGSGFPVRWPALAIGVALLALAAAPALVRVLISRRRWRGAIAAGPAAMADAAWAEARDTSVDYGCGWPDQETPRQFAQRVGRHAGLGGAAQASLDRVARAAERARYARDVGVVGDLRADVMTIRAGLRAGSGRRTRARARLLPRSTAALRHAAGERIADVLDWVDTRAAAARARVTPRRGAS
jgi:transglutaminase-like putative cysteine protease